MRLTAVRCKECQNVYQGDLERCPFCGRKSPQGWRDHRLKWVAVLIFLIVLAVVAYAFFHSPGGH